MTKFTPIKKGLISYHYAKNIDLSPYRDLFLIGDCGAFSAHASGAKINPKDVAKWGIENRNVLLWSASLDVFRDIHATRRNWHIANDDYGIEMVPTLHFGAPIEEISYYASRGVDFIGLGGLAGREAPVSGMRWLIQCFKYAKKHHPQVKFHGWGLTSRDACKLPFFSTDSSAWSSSSRYGNVALLDNYMNRVTFRTNGKDAFLPMPKKILKSVYGFDPKQVALNTPETRRNIDVLSMKVSQHRGKHFHAVHSEIPAPVYGINKAKEIGPGPHLHIAVASKMHLDYLQSIEE